MREKKYKVWDKEFKSFVEPYLYFINLDGSIWFNLGASACSRDNLVDQSEKLTAVEYTGLNDKNGKEIYEGDIIRILYTDWPSNPAPDNQGLDEYKKSISSVGVVKFYGAGWKLNFGEHPDGIDHGSIYEGTHGEKEIIGNIHESPELLNAEG